MEEEHERRALEWVTLPDGSRVHAPRLVADDEENTGNDPTNPSDKGFHLLEKVRSAWGSTAGAGSDFFHVYRKQRAREMARVEAMEKDWQELEEARAFQKQREARIQANLERQVKKAEKRNRRKVNRAIRKANAGAAEREEARKARESGNKGDVEDIAEKAPAPPQSGVNDPSASGRVSAVEEAGAETKEDNNNNEAVQGGVQGKESEKVRVVDLEDEF